MQTSNGVKKTSETKEVELQRERELQELKQKTRELEEAKIALMNILEDIAEAQRKMEEEKNKTLSIITNLADGLLFFDKENRLVLANPQSEIFFAIASKTILGKTIAELMAAPNIGQVLALINTEITSVVVVKDEVSIRDGLILELITIPVIQESKKIGTMIILRDISREKLIEQMKTEFVSLTAHQLRTPLSAIKWTLRMLLDGDLGKINVEQKSFLQKTYASNERMIRLINDLLNVTRIEEGKFIYKASCIQLENIITEVIDTFKDKIQIKEIDFHFKKPLKKLPLVMVDPEKIQIAISNLIDNAIDYTTKNGKISIFLAADKEKLTFTIQDSGIGIPKDQQSRVFSKFFRADNVIKIDTDGTGLGAFIAKNIIEAHNGKIWFDSKEDKGTAFFFSLPIQAQQSSCAHPKKMIE